LGAERIQEAMRQIILIIILAHLPVQDLRKQGKEEVRIINPYSYELEDSK